jgi:transcriptional regulator with XRE-family HTH domain
MLKTVYKNLKSARKWEKLSQKQMGAIIGRSPNYWSEIESGKWPVPEEYLELIEKELGYRKEWLRHGTGEPKGEGQQLAEGTTGYGIDYSKGGCKMRFAQQVSTYMVEKDFTLRDVALEWELNENQLSMVVNGPRDPSLDMLIKSARFGKLNLNYCAAAVGSLFIGNEVAALTKLVESQAELLKVYREEANPSGRQRRKSA